MTHNDDSTMAASEAAGTAFKEVTRKNKSKRLKTAPVQKTPVQRTHNYTIRITFPTLRSKMKFNPLTSTCAVFQEMLKYDSTITVTIPNDSHQLVLSSDPIPMLEADFKKFFTVTTDTQVTGNKSFVIIGCTITSDRTLRDIKFDTTTPTKFIDWLKKEKIFVESDSLGVQKTVTAGYLFKLHPRLTN